MKLEYLLIILLLAVILVDFLLKRRAKNLPKEIIIYNPSRTKNIIFKSSYYLIIIVLCFGIFYYVPNNYFTKVNEAKTNESKLNAIEKLDGFYSYFKTKQKNNIKFDLFSDFADEKWSGSDRNTDPFLADEYVQKALALNKVSDKKIIDLRITTLVNYKLTLDKFINDFHVDRPVEGDELYDLYVRNVGTPWNNKDTIVIPYFTDKVRESIHYLDSLKNSDSPLLDEGDKYSVDKLKFYVYGSMNYLTDQMLEDMDYAEYMLGPSAPRYFFWDNEDKSNYELSLAENLLDDGSKSYAVIDKIISQHGVRGGNMNYWWGINYNATNAEYKKTKTLIENNIWKTKNSNYQWTNKEIMHFYQIYFAVLSGLKEDNKFISEANKFLSLKDWEEILKNDINTEGTIDFMGSMANDIRWIYYKLGRIKFDKNDWLGSMKAYEKALKVLNYDEINEKGVAGIKCSSILRNLFAAKWNYRENGDKLGACDDLRIAANFDSEEYYDYYIKNCAN